jgi:hypothetical protein
VIAITDGIKRIPIPPLSRHASARRNSQKFPEIGVRCFPCASQFWETALRALARRGKGTVSGCELLSASTQTSIFFSYTTSAHSSRAGRRSPTRAVPLLYGEPEFECFFASAGKHILKLPLRLCG